MRAISNAFLKQAEVEQKGHWQEGPLELAFFDVEHCSKNYDECVVLAAEWNGSYEGGYIRPGKWLEQLQALVPGLNGAESPNVFIVPRVNGVTPLDTMLASLVPLRILERHGIRKKVRCNLWLTPFGLGEYRPDFGERCRNAFEEFVWPIMVPGSRHQARFFAADSPLRLLAGDSRFWMHRIYRTALSLYEELPPTTHREKSWKSLSVLRKGLFNDHPTLSPDSVIVRRPRMGGELWEPTDEADCRRVVKRAMSGDNERCSLEQVIDIVLSDRAHEDFSDRHSWVKEDFERSFYSKRSKLKVTLVETVDSFPAWEAAEPQGYEQLLYRDVLSILDVKERRLVVALRQGKTATELAKEYGYADHSPMSRSIAALKTKVGRLLAD